MSEIRSSYETALERASARYVLRCWQCGRDDEVDEDPRRTVYTCDDCGAASAYGSPQPPIAILPHADRRFVISRITQPAGPENVGAVTELTLERGYAARYAMELLSVCDETRYKAIQALEEIGRRALKAAMAVKDGGSNPGSNSELEEDGVTLDAPM